MRFTKRSKSITFQFIVKKASLIACLFFIQLNVTAQDSLTVSQKKAYDLVLNLQWAEARTLAKDNSPYSIYITSLCNTFELLLNEDKELLDRYEVVFEKQLLALQNQKVSAETLFAQAELQLHWAFVRLKFEHEFDGALKLRRGYHLATQGRKEYPDFLPLLKSHGLLQILLGAVPEKHNWVLRMMNMEGSTETGISELQALSSSTCFINVEASIFLALIHGYVMQDPLAARNYLQSISEDHLSTNLVRFLSATLALKNNDAERSLQLLNGLTRDDLPLAYYLTGEALLYKGDYGASIQSFQWYIQHFKGKSLLKDAHFKIGVCYQLLLDKTKATHYFSLARNIGTESTEADKYADRVLNSAEGLNTKLTRIRFLSDGGYYEQARKAVLDISPPDIPTLKEQIEFYYRQARLAHLSNNTNAARLFYEQVIDMSGDPEKSNWYFAPNSALQLGYIKMMSGDETAARIFFNKAISYKKHEYKNSIDTKAKAALNQLTEPK